jgi:hypothetical protein
VLTFFAQDHASAEMVYANADLTKAEQAGEILAFADYWNNATGSDPGLLVFDSQLTTYKILEQLSGRGIRRLTLRQRGRSELDRLAALPAPAWKTVTISRSGRYRRPRLHEDMIKIKDLSSKARQIAVTIVFLRFDANMNSAGLFVVKTNDGQLRQILPASMILNIGADWSPQGNEIIFSRHVTPDVLGSIWVVHANGTGLHEIHIRGLGCGASFSDPSGVGCHGARWSPVGKKIIFVAISPATGVKTSTRPTPTAPPSPR